VEHSYANVNLTEEDFSAGPRTDARPVRRLIAVGTHDQLYKGHDDLIRALALLVARGPDLHLDLMGDGRHHDTLRQLARALRVEDRVTFHGRVNAREDLRQLLDEADLFCMPSRTEGLPRALIEAMARGVPAIGTAVGGILELIEPRFCTRPSDPEALAELIATFADGTVDVALVSREVWRRAQQCTPSRQAERMNNWLGEITRLARSDT
jgi:phosphatidylinositol alpha-1,6-mannosyltransferase